MEPATPNQFHYTFALTFSQLPRVRVMNEEMQFSLLDQDCVHHGHDPAELWQQEALHDGDVGHRSDDGDRVRAGDQDRVARRRWISASAGGRGRVQLAEAAAICESGMKFNITFKAPETKLHS